MKLLIKITRVSKTSPQNNSKENIEHIREIHKERYIQRLKFALAIGKCWGFCWSISMFFSIGLGKKNAKAIKCLRILQKHVAKNKIYFCFKKKRNVPLNKKVIFVFHTIFNIYCIIHRCLYSIFILLSFSYISF